MSAYCFMCGYRGFFFILCVLFYKKKEENKLKKKENIKFTTKNQNTFKLNTYKIKVKRKKN